MAKAEKRATTTQEARPLVGWLAEAIRQAYHGCRFEVVTLAEATGRLYPKQGPRWEEDSLHWPRWQHMRKVYDRTKGRSFVFEPSPEMLAGAGVDDVGPLYVWPLLWSFAGCPKLDKNGWATERPSWKVPRGCYGIAFWNMVSLDRQYRRPRPWVTRLRNHQRKSARRRPGKRGGAAAGARVRQFDDPRRRRPGRRGGVAA